MSQNNFQLQDWTPFGGKPVNSKIILLFAALLAIFVLSLPAWQTLPMLKLREPAPNILQLLSTLFFVALVVERALEVWINTLRRPIADGKEFAVQLKKEELAKADESKNVQIQVELDILLKDQIRYKSETTLIALWSAAIFGLLISAVGVRTLEAVFEVGMNSGALQPGLFHEVDVFATGLLIAGGSAVIHAVIQAFTELATATQTLARNASSPDSNTPPPTPTPSAQQICTATAPVKPLPAAAPANMP